MAIFLKPLSANGFALHAGFENQKAKCHSSAAAKTQHAQLLRNTNVLQNIETKGLTRGNCCHTRAAQQFFGGEMDLCVVFSEDEVEGAISGLDIAVGRLREVALSSQFDSWRIDEIRKVIRARNTIIKVVEKRALAGKSAAQEEASCHAE